MISVLLFFLQLIILYFLSRVSIRELFFSLRWIFKSEKLVFVLISLLFLPGTLIHEISHFFMAIALVMRVRDITILPQWEDKGIKLGRVLYEKRDVISGFIVGIAPVFGGLFFLWIISYFHIFPQPNIAINAVLIFLIFSISTSMFSSKQDLVDAVFMIPLVLVIGAILYIFNINIFSFVNTKYTIIADIVQFFSSINGYMFFTICIHSGLILLLVLLRKVFKYA
ncbi:hypothetical protein HGA88_01150 [Candidatus Roizmanbacteria bacterium]|nr:hypothetical protein [Candidatus Roizmanbacteria bacterium]